MCQGLNSQLQRYAMSAGGTHLENVILTRFCSLPLLLCCSSLLRGVVFSSDALGVPFKPESALCRTCVSRALGTKTYLCHVMIVSETSGSDEEALHALCR